MENQTVSAVMTETTPSIVKPQAGAVQLYATIKRSSEYRHQHDGKVPFPVEFTDSGFSPHVVLGNDNRYRIADLRFYVKVGDQFVALS